MKPNVPSPRSSSDHSVRPARTGQPRIAAQSESDDSLPTLEEGIRHIELALKQGKSFRQMQLEWRQRN